MNNTGRIVRLTLTPKRPSLAPEEFAFAQSDKEWEAYSEEDRAKQMMLWLSSALEYLYNVKWENIA